MNSGIRQGLIAGAVTVACAGLLAGCGKKAEETTAPEGSAAAGGDKELNLFIWTDYLAPDTIANFEKETGIKVNLTNYTSNEELESKLAAGSAGYDVVVPSASFYEKQIKAGFYQKLDKAQLPNLKNMDPDIQARLAKQDPGNDYAVLHMWGTTGIGYNVDKIKAAMPNAPVDSWRMVFDPSVVKNFQKCGVGVLDSATEVVSMTLAYLGKDPNSQDPKDIEAAAATLMKIRPYIRYVDSARLKEDLASGEICLAICYNGDILQARDVAETNNTGQTVAYSFPKEGTIMWYDSYLIPKDAPHPRAAHAFINYMLKPEVIAAVTNEVNYANGNSGAAEFVKADVKNDPGVYPPADVRAKLFPDLADTEETNRRMTRLWTQFMTGR